LYSHNGGDQTSKHEPNEYKRTANAEHKPRRQKAHTKKLEKKTYKANRATVAASYFAKSIEVVNKQLCAKFCFNFLFHFSSGDLKLFP
jgi:hypothetical protein